MAEETPAVLIRPSREGVQGPVESESRMGEKCMKLTSILSVWIILMGCLSSAQIFMFHLSLKLGNATRSIADANTNTTSSSSERMKAIKIYLIVVWAAVTPYLINIVRAIKIIWGRNMIVPNRKMVFWGTLGAILESVGISLLIIKVFPLYNGVVCSLLICCISVIPLPSILRRTHRDWRWYFALSAVILQAVATIFMIIWSAMNKSSSQIIALVCLSVAWLPQLQKRSVQLTSDEAQRRAPAESESEQGNSRNVGMSPKRTEAAWEMALISNIIKTFCVLAIGSTMFVADKSIYSGDIPWYIVWEEFQQAWNWTWNYDVQVYVILIITCTIAHGVGLFLCKISKSMFLLLFPGYMSNVIVLLALWNSRICHVVLPRTPEGCRLTQDPEWALIASTVMLALAAIVSLIVFGVKRKHVILRREAQIVWLPTFSSIAPSMWMILNKRMWPWDKEQQVVVSQYKKAQIFICTTMYRETRDEMSEHIKSFKNINTIFRNEEEATRYEFHIILDDGAHNREPTKSAAGLLSVLSSVLEIPYSEFIRVFQPYGVKFSWKPRSLSSFRHPLNIHLKDIAVVKTKKRWSQVMLMKYITNHMEARNDAERYILATDGDVMFDGDSVETLVDLMTRDKRVGVVTGRTHPYNIGPGVAVWYQVFDYAVRHWLKKTAEHKMGSVVCTSGCFSLFRCEALKQVQSDYSTDVNSGLDFLTKDMGEHRWLCTLLAEKGWAIEYCASSNNKTNCPDTFEELYKQRRRWLITTIANMWLLMRDYMTMSNLKKKGMIIGNIFLMYQVVLLWAILTAPGTAILIVTGGLQLAFGSDLVVLLLALIIQVIIVLVYLKLCYCENLSGKHQLTVALFISFIYFLAMLGVAYGTVYTVIEEIVHAAKKNSDNVSDDPDMYYTIPLSATSIFVITLVGIYLVASILHWDFTSFFCGLFYFLFLPSEYLVLVIYSLCNVTDKSWGTREERIPLIGEKSLFFLVKKQLKKIGPCFMWMARQIRKCLPKRCTGIDLISDDENLLMLEVITSLNFTADTNHIPANGMSVESWLEEEFVQEKFARLYSDPLRNNGYENTMFLSQIEIEDLEKIGIARESHRKILMKGINRLPTQKVSVTKPTDLKEWLNDVGLGMYKSEEDLKPTDICDTEKPVEKIAEILQIKKQGHIDRLAYALKCVRYPNKDEVAAEKAKEETKRCKTIDLAKSDDANEDAIPVQDSDDSGRGDVITSHEDSTDVSERREIEMAAKEYKFWKDLIERCLDSRVESNISKKQLNADLVQIRKRWLVVMVLSNVIWLAFTVCLASSANLATPGLSIIGIILLVIFLFLPSTQFVAMLFHRGDTLIHRHARMSSFRPSSDCCRRNDGEDVSDERSSFLRGTGSIQDPEQAPLIQQSEEAEEEEEEEGEE